MSGSTSKRYPAELRERAVRMVAEIRAEHESEWAAIGRVAGLLGVGTPETVRNWCRQAGIDAGAGPGVTTEESAELKRLRRENAELKRANAILPAGRRGPVLRVVSPAVSFANGDDSPARRGRNRGAARAR